MPTKVSPIANEASQTDRLDLLNRRRRTPVNWRSVSLGLLGVILIGALTAYNDFAINNTYLIGTYLPVGVVLLLLFLILGINVPLFRFAPRQAIDSGELTVITAMMLVSCALPASGLMRYLPTHLVGLWWHAGQNREYLELLRDLHLPDWWFPHFASSDLNARTHDPVVSDFFNRAATDGDSFWAHLRAAPYRAWLAPFLGWSAFLMPLYGAILCLSVIVRRQWVENERLAFPIASVYSALIEPPVEGKALNSLFRSRSFWIAGAAVFAIHLLNGLHQYDAQRWPEIPVRFNLSSLLSNPPWNFLSAAFKAATVSFAILGLSFFLQSNVALSLWFFYVVQNAVLLYAGPVGLSYADYQPRKLIGADQLFGGCIPFVAMMLWIGRQHWAMVLKQMLSRREADSISDPSRRGKYLSHRAAGWGLVICIAIMIGWLRVSGTTLAGATCIVLLMLMVYLVAARIVAETGLMFVQVNVPLNRFWAYLSKDLPAALASRTTLNNYFTASFLTASLTHDVRENLTVFATQSLRIADEQEEISRDGSYLFSRSFIACLVVALVVGLLVSGVGFLYTEYTYAVTLDRTGMPLNSPWGIDQSIKEYALNPSVDFRLHGGPTNESHHRLAHFAFGAAVVTALASLRMRFAWWPLHPVGYLLMHTYVVEVCWFSIFLGWLAKVLIVRYGGASLFHRARNLFMGLIVGELTAAGFWLVVSLVLHALGYSYTAINLLPA